MKCANCGTALSCGCQKRTTKDGKQYSGLISKNEEETTNKFIDSSGDSWLEPTPEDLQFHY